MTTLKERFVRTLLVHACAGLFFAGELHAEGLIRPPFSPELVDAFSAIHFSEYTRAEAQLSHAAAGGDWVATEFLGRFYLAGLGQPPNVPKGMQLIADACDHENKFACQYIGFLYDSGEVVPRDINTAINWYRRAGEDWRISQLQEVQSKFILLEVGRLPGAAPPTCEARHEFDDYVRAVYKQLDAHIDVPPISRHWGGAQFEVDLDSAGDVMDIQLQALMGGSPALGLTTLDAATRGWLTWASEYTSDQMRQFTDQIKAGIRAAAPLARAPSWLPPYGFSLRYPYPDLTKLHNNRQASCPTVSAVGFP